MFISMAYLVIQNSADAIMLARAGHDAPLLFRAADRTVTKVNPPGMALGIDSGNVFDRVTADFKVRLDPGDCLILYTDGVTEALDLNGSEFGIGRLIEVIKAGDGGSAGTDVTGVKENRNEVFGKQ